MICFRLCQNWNDSYFDTIKSTFDYLPFSRNSVVVQEIYLPRAVTMEPFSGSLMKIKMLCKWLVSFVELIREFQIAEGKTLTPLVGTRKSDCPNDTPVKRVRQF